LRAKSIILLLFLFIAFSVPSVVPVDGVSLRLLWGSHLLAENIFVISKSRAESQDTRLQSDLGESLTLLESTRGGRSLAGYARDKRIAVRFGFAATSGVAAAFVPEASGSNGGEIIVEPDYSSQPSRVLAAILAHEITHAKSYGNWTELSARQEMIAYKAQARVWQELRAGFRVKIGALALEVFESSPENDYALWISRAGKRQALRSIELDYRRLGVGPT
jgi:hypothetical protein